MAKRLGSPKCIAHWWDSAGWHLCDKNSPHRGGEHECACGCHPQPQNVLTQPWAKVRTGRQSFGLHLSAFRCTAKADAGSGRCYTSLSGLISTPADGIASCTLCGRAARIEGADAVPAEYALFCPYCAPIVGLGDGSDWVEAKRNAGRP